MTHLTRHFAVVFLGLAVVLAGCQKKPSRPNPSQTMVGPGAGSRLNPQSVNTNDLFAADDSDLESRGSGDMAALGDQQRGVLPSVYFDFNSASISVSERPKLSQAADYLSGSPPARLVLEGHCDWRGTTEYNMGLGDRRAASVKTFLETLGVDISRVETLSKGDLEANKNSSDDQMQQDRRVEFVIVR
jgi:peptidoglycan-associated lipoprotein